MCVAACVLYINVTPNPHSILLLDVECHTLVMKKNKKKMFKYNVRLLDATKKCPHMWLHNALAWVNLLYPKPTLNQVRVTHEYDGRCAWYARTIDPQDLH